MCELVEVPRSSFHAWRNHKPSARDLADAELLEVIRDIYGDRAAPTARPVSTVSSDATDTGWDGPESPD